MNISRKIIFSLVVLLSCMFFLDRVATSLLQVEAYSTSCPKEIENTPECLVFLQKQKDLINAEKNSFKSGLSNEQYQQLSLLEKINYIDSILGGMENKIDQLEVEIETKNVEIRILSREIENLTNNIETITQEVQKIESSVEKRISISYKYSFITPVEMLFENANFDNLLRKFKYLSEAKKKDKEILLEMTTKSQTLNTEHKLLAEKQVEVEKKRLEIEEEKTSQFELKEEMSKQRQEREYLYAESKKREAELLAKLNAAREAESGVESAIQKWIADHPEALVESGYVTAGTYIGRMGSTGCSTAPHLHFTIEYSNQPLGYGSINPWNGYLSKGPGYWAVYNGWTYWYIKAGSMSVPLTGNAFLTQDHHKGWSAGGPYTVDFSSTDGTSTYVRAAKAGTLYKGVEPICGGKYAKIVHSGGLQTTYLHLK